jgi:CRP/FNR family cyclic AMP-dependent transcriptional regulator
MRVELSHRLDILIIMSTKQFDGSILSGSGLFQGLEKEALDSLARYSRHISLEPNERLFNQGDSSDGCYAILDGVLKVATTSSDGKEALLAMLGSGDVIGDMGLIDAQPRSASATALKPCSLAFLASRDFKHVANSNPVIYLQMLEILSERLRTSNEAATMQRLLPLRGRLARVLLRLAEGFGEPLEGGRILIRQKFTQIELGRMSGSARENVNRQVKEWANEGLVSRISGYYCLEDSEKLRQFTKL